MRADSARQAGDLKLKPTVATRVQLPRRVFCGSSALDKKLKSDIHAPPRGGPTQARPTALDEFMAYQVMHSKQVESKKAVLAAAAQVDDMYDMLAAYEQKVGAPGRLYCVAMQLLGHYCTLSSRF